MSSCQTTDVADVKYVWDCNAVFHHVMWSFAL